MKKLEQTIIKYVYLVEYDEEDKIFIARCAEFPDLAAHGKTQQQALEEIKTVVLESVKWMKKEKEPIPEPLCLHNFSGEFRLRMPPEKHKKVAIEAAAQGVSMNQLIISKL